MKNVLLALIVVCSVSLAGCCTSGCGTTTTNDCCGTGDYMGNWY